LREGLGVEAGKGLYAGMLQPVKSFIVRPRETLVYLSVASVAKKKKFDIFDTWMLLALSVPR
jgi:hypothetical protein